MTDDQIWGDFQFEEPSNKFLMLNAEIMERICRLLNDKKDSYEACLIHPYWSIAAVKVLWEAPRFQRPEQLRAFMNTIFSSKKAALMVRNLYLVLLDKKEETVFKTVVRSNLDRHSKENSKVLASPKFLNRPVTICEELTALTCYGWQMGRADWEQLSVMARHLVKLRIIGGSPKNQLGINNFLSRLTSLHLDGRFNIDDTWAINLINRATQLDDLQLSLSNLQYNTLELICTPNHLKLKKLSLTGASEIKDVHVDRVLRAFPGLIKFCLEGCTHISAQTIVIALEHCRYLQNLEIRAHSDTLQQKFPITIEVPNPEWAPKLTSLLVENMCISDSNLRCLDPFLPQLQTLGLKSCPDVTNMGLRSIVDNSYIRSIRRLHLIDCPNINSSLFSEEGLTLAISLYDLYIDSCGYISPIDIHSLCSQSVAYSLHQIRLVNCKGLKNSVLSSFDCSPDSTSMITLNKISIGALIHSNDPQLCPMPDDRLLTGRQIISLSKKLDMTVKELVNIIDEAQKANDNEFSNTTQNISGEAYKTAPKSRGNRLDALRPSTTPRPSTPALWSKDFIENGEIGNVGVSNSVASHYSKNYPESYSENKTMAPQTYSENCRESEVVTPQTYSENYTENNTTTLHNQEAYSENYRESNEDEDFEEDGVVGNCEDIKEEVTSSQFNDSRSNFGGWGESGSNHNNLWNTTQPISYPRTQTKVESWSKTKKLDFWQQQEIKSTQQLFKTPNSNKHYRNSPYIREGEGWGEPEKVIPWEDLRTQGYAHDVLKQQKETTFWKEVDGVWHECQSADLSSEKTEPKTYHIQTETQSLFSVLDEDHEKSYGSRLPRVSPDGNSGWDNDINEKLVVKVNPKQESYKFSNKGTNTVDGRVVKERLFSEEITATTAKNGWGEIAKSNPMPRRQSKPIRNGNRVAGREEIPRENMPGRWKEFSADSLYALDSATNGTPSPNSLRVSDQQQMPKQQVFSQKTPQQPVAREVLIQVQDSSPKCELLVDLGDDNKNNMWQTTTANHTHNSMMPERAPNKDNNRSVSAKNCFWFEDQVPKAVEEKNTQPNSFSQIASEGNESYTDNIVELNDALTANVIPVFENASTVSKPLHDPMLGLSLSPPIESATESTTDPDKECITESTKESVAESPPEPTVEPITEPIIKQITESTTKTAKDLTPTAGCIQVPTSDANSSLITIPPFADSEDEIKLYKSQPNYLGSLRVYISSSEFRYLVLRLEEDVEESVKRFCEQYHVEQNASILLETARPMFIRRRTKKILKTKE
ncbi:hypothetical protein BY458DRAFT_492435 [Sporodiniella umbellata]|nr:hypothetical protein BY458DRAFT_492435 [Sporodiniella umbellata]